ncbi:hypothetical protein [Halalkalibacter alkalisediminis]|uniref:Uncharacterized protein n=1 Tax=Halalkalibacter alkalisediminis TaxID=935616 RepID=A0ABV6NJN5_9BACI|nr:hypothetical protein [Halalkalibacter alkalisediminis]
MRKKIILASIACILAVGSIFIFSNEQIEEAEVISEIEEIEEAAMVHRQAETEQVENKAVVHEIISDTHHLLNNITGYGNHEKYRDASSADWEKIKKELQSEANQVERALDFAEETVKEDLKNFVHITRYAADSHDHTALLYSHRIIHDVDTIYNDKQKKTFNAARISSWNGSAKKTVEKLLNRVGSDE